MVQLAYKDDEMPYEMIDGKIVAMARPSIYHDTISGNIRGIFKRFLKGRTCRVFGEVDVFLTSKDNVIPDVIVVCNKDIIKYNGIHGTPDLIVEVLSPSTSARDRMYKKKLYERCGVKEYWIVSPPGLSIEVYLLKDDILELDAVYTIIPNYELRNLSEQRQQEVKYSFKSPILGDHDIVLEEVFEDLIPSEYTEL